MEAAMSNGIAGSTKEAFQMWLENMDDASGSKEASEQVIAACEKDNSQVAKEILSLKQYLVKKSVWMFGGDGWAYDIGYGGLDHVLASGEDVNALVLDTEVYSNTGGQSSKATPLGAVAKFASAGKRTSKKDLGRMAMNYGYVYVAQISMGANEMQALRAIREAEAYKGPSIIIAFSPCIAHGYRSGMRETQSEMKEAVKSGYWHLYRYNPELEAQGKNPFQLDSKEPDWSRFQQFINAEVRYTALKKGFPEVADQLFEMAEENAKWSYQSYKRLAEMDYSKK
jgi:pyruvate-ferredoxin/flavodoxin oxidoreductase